MTFPCGAGGIVLPRQRPKNASSTGRSRGGTRHSGQRRSSWSLGRSCSSKDHSSSGHGGGSSSKTRGRPGRMKSRSPRRRLGPQSRGA